jgi:HEPN domain-containing protein
MRNAGLADDYVRRAEVRLRAIDVLYAAGSWADVVRESQEAVELALKGLLRHVGVETPRVHDVSDVLLSCQDRLVGPLREEVARLAEISKDLRRDRELAFYGAEDLTPSDFYSKEDASTAREGARFVVSSVVRFVRG